MTRRLWNVDNFLARIPIDRDQYATTSYANFHVSLSSLVFSIVPSVSSQAFCHDFLSRTLHKADAVLIRGFSKLLPYWHDAVAQPVCYAMLPERSYNFIREEGSIASTGAHRLLLLGDGWGSRAVRHRLEISTPYSLPRIISGIVFLSDGYSSALDPRSTCGERKSIAEGIYWICRSVQSSLPCSFHFRIFAVPDELRAVLFVVRDPRGSVPRSWTYSIRAQSLARSMWRDSCTHIRRHAFLTALISVWHNHSLSIHAPAARIGNHDLRRLIWDLTPLFSVDPVWPCRRTWPE
nr:hypothetical protein CFP56_54480 [Quercus suber]